MSDASTASGPGRILVAVYAVFALAATARSSVQIGTDFDQARLAYSLSAVAAVVYIVATVALARGARALAWAACGLEAIGVFIVGTASLMASEHFPDATVWSVYGQGYGYVPAVLPLLGLGWLWRTRQPSR